MPSTSPIAPIILSITGSDGTGGAGVQADVMTISALGGRAVTAITSVTVQGLSGIQSVHALSAEIVAGQVRALVNPPLRASEDKLDSAQSLHPAAIKLGLVGDAATMAALSDYIVGCPRVVVDPGIISSSGTRLMDPLTPEGQAALSALRRYILPETNVLLLRCSEAELLLDTHITTDEDMLRVARQLTEMGPAWVMLRGGQHAEGRLTALLYGEGHEQFFSSYNIEGWQRHGVGGALSSAIATCLAQGDDVPSAVRRAHDYLHSQVVYATQPGSRSLRPAELYNRLLSLIAAHHRTAHDVAFYADRLAITPRYLSQVTRSMVEKSPKQVIDGYLLHEAETLLRTTSLSVQEVATYLGFSSPVQLSKFVQKERGLSPTELRKTRQD